MNITTDMRQLKVAKSNKLIEMTLVESSVKLALNSQKVILSLIAQIHPKDQDFKEYEVSISDLIKMTGISQKHLYSEIDDICERLVTTSITIKEPDNKKGFSKSAWCANAEYLPGDGHVKFMISPKLKKYLILLKKNFTFYHLKQVINLNSAYYIRIYELLRQFLTLKKVAKGTYSEIRDIKLADLRSYLGVGDEKYKKFAEFRRNIIDKAKKDLESKTDIKFEYKTIRKGRKVHSIRFFIRHNEKFEMIDDNSIIEGEIDEAYDLSEFDLSVVNNIKKHVNNISDSQIALIFSSYEKDLIIDSIIDFAGSKSANHIDIKNEAKYFLKILSKKKLAYEYVRTKNTSDNLTDRSWAEGIDFDDEPDF